MRVLVSGSREVGDPEQAKDVVWARVQALPEDAVVVHGGAKGVDTWAATFAFQLGLATEVWKANWRTLDGNGKEVFARHAGLVRNNAMLDSGVDLVLAFWNGISKGTLHVIKGARERRIPVEVIPLEPPSKERT